MGALGKNAYALAFGGSDFSRILLNNKGHKHPPMSPHGPHIGAPNNVMDNLMRKSLNQEDTTSFLKNQNPGDIVVPRDFMIKTAYVKKRRNQAANDTQSVRSR